MKYVRILQVTAVSLLLVPVMAFAQTTTGTTTTAAPATTTVATTTGPVLPTAALTPASPFYFLTQWGEALQEFFTFSPEAKAQLELQFAAQRIAEINTMIQDQGANAPGIAVAQAGLAANIAKANTAVTQVKSSGGNVAALAQNLSQAITQQKITLQNVFADAQGKVVAQQTELQQKLQEADRVGSTTQAQEIAQQLSSLQTQKTALVQHQDNATKELSDAGDTVDTNLNSASASDAQGAINDVLNNRANALVQNPALNLTLVDKAISDAQDMLTKGDDQAATELAKQAADALDRAKNAAERVQAPEVEAESSRALQLLQKYGVQLASTTLPQLPPPGELEGEGMVPNLQGQQPLQNAPRPGEGEQPNIPLPPSSSSTQMAPVQGLRILNSSDQGGEVPQQNTSDNQPGGDN
ncbi:hypothetical protein KGO95_00350 [Patescibacteria group bacterium]|nr:hypothetical protein [Patescibacteria group bacterium]